MVRGLLHKNEKSPTGFEITTDYWIKIGNSDGDFES